MQTNNEDRSECAEAQTDLSLCSMHMSEGIFSHIEMHMFS